MKKLFFALIISAFALQFGQSQSLYEFSLLGKWDDDALPIASPNNLKLQYSGCWGLAVNGHEYAVIGGAEHVLFFDVTVPATPKLVGKFQGTANTVWREFKSYKNRIYAVSDGTTEGLMIFDLSHAEDTIVRTYWSNEFFEKAHTITLDTTSGRIYLNGGSATKGVIILDVSQNPDQPSFISHPLFPPIQQNPQGKLHDSYVRNDTLYASAGYDGYFVYDMKDANNPVLLAQITPGGYNHNSWLNTAGTYAYVTEEIPDGRPILIIDLQLLANNDLEIAGSFLDKFTPAGGNHTAIPHNIYIKDNILFDSQYEDGLLAYDISNPTQPVFLARYDTHPENTVYNQYHGNWGNYPWLPSGNIIAGDMQNGLFVLKFSPTAVDANAPEKQLSVQVSPNPAQEVLNIRLQSEVSGSWNWSMRNTAGQVLSNGTEQAPAVTLRTAGLPRGLYFMTIQDAAGKTALRKVVLN